MAAIMRVVAGVGGSTILDLNAAAGGGVMAARGDKVLAQINLTDAQASDTTVWWTPATTATEVASRRISLPLVVQGTSQDDIAARISAIHAAVDTPWVLEVRRHGASTSGFLRCMPATLDVQARVTSSSVAFADVVLTADTEPYALGAMVDAGSLTFSQDTSVSSALRADITGVPGDALAPTLIRWAQSGPVGAGVTTHASVWAVRRHGTPSSLGGLLIQGEAPTASSGTPSVTLSTVTGDTAMCGNSAARATFSSGATVGATATWEYALSVTAAQAAGTYRLFGRFRRSGGAAGVELSITPKVNGYGLRSYTYGAGVDTMTVDLGLVQIPAGQPVRVSAPIAAPLPSLSPTVSVAVKKSGAAGAGVVDLDWLALLPADADLGYWRVQQPDSTRWAFADAFAQETGYATADPIGAASLAGVEPAANTAWFGGMLRLAPGANRLYCVQGLTAAAVWPKTLSVAASVAYWPRYRWLP